VGEREEEKKKENRKENISTLLRFEYIRLYFYRFCTEKFKLQNKTKPTPSSICLSTVIKIQKVVSIAAIQAVDPDLFPSQCTTTAAMVTNRPLRSHK